MSESSVLSILIGGMLLSNVALSNLPSKAPSTYVTHSDGTVSDVVTGLMWKRCAEGFSGASCKNNEELKYQWNEALALNDTIFAGYNDWRLPTVDELSGLVDCYGGVRLSEVEEKTCNNVKGYDSMNSPTINKAAFPNTLSEEFWSASPYEAEASEQWLRDHYASAAMFVDFSDGAVNASFRSSRYYVRLVRTEKIAE